MDDIMYFQNTHFESSKLNVLVSGMAQTLIDLVYVFYSS